MSSDKPGIYLIIEFNWPQPFNLVDGPKARKLHDTIQSSTWIKEMVAASGGLGAGPSSLWIFWLQNYAALDKLFKAREDEVAKAYHDFFSNMPLVIERIRDEVAFL